MLFGFILIAQTLVGKTVEISIKPNQIDLKYFEALREKALELKYKEEQKQNRGCPFEPGTYWNLECV